MENEALAWVNMAKQDLAVAKHLNAKFLPKPLEIICYHCQQAAEKAVRYPNELFLEERHVRDAIIYADKMLSWAESLV